jgi:hypothetical protein
MTPDHGSTEEETVGDAPDSFISTDPIPDEDLARAQQYVRERGWCDEHDRPEGARDGVRQSIIEARATEQGGK